jgi:hypothetical protein
MDDIPQVSEDGNTYLTAFNTEEEFKKHWFPN